MTTDRRGFLRSAVAAILGGPALASLPAREAAAAPMGPPTIDLESFIREAVRLQFEAMQEAWMRDHALHGSGSFAEPLPWDWIIGRAVSPASAQV